MKLFKSKKTTEEVENMKEEQNMKKTGKEILMKLAIGVGLLGGAAVAVILALGKGETPDEGFDSPEENNDDFCEETE